MDNILIMIIVGLTGVVGGYLFRMADSRVTSAFMEDRAKDAAAKEEAAREAAPKKLDEHSVLRVTVDPTLKWHLELDEVPLDPDGLTPDQRARLVNVIVQIRPWIDGKVSGPVSAPVVSAPPPAPAPMPMSPYMVQAPSPTPPAAGPAAPAGSLRLDPRRGFRSLLENEVKKPEVFKGPSIVAMIDAVLQKKLEASPFADKHIRLEEGSLGEVIVYVGVQRYSGVEAVPDDAIQSLIKQSIADWNAQN